jgi:cytochrome c oxidase subunit 1
MSQTTESTAETGFETEDIDSLLFARVAFAGFAGVVAMAPVLVTAWYLGFLEASSFAGFGLLFGVGPSLPLGVLVYTVGGTLVFPTLFFTVATFLPGRTLVRRGVVIAFCAWGGFLFGFYTGQTGVALAGYVLFTLLAHLVYGVVVGAIVDRIAGIIQWEV